MGVNQHNGVDCVLGLYRYGVGRRNLLQLYGLNGLGRLGEGLSAEEER